MRAIDKQLFFEPEGKFTEHISIPNNSRIIFSSKFGTGKSTFLKNFFSEEGFTKKGKTQYEVFHLFPVNYSIASNEDILELIKYDITLELLKKNERISVYQEGINTTTSFVKKHFDKVIELVITSLPKINPSVTFVDIPSIIKSLFKLKRDYEAHAKKENLLVNQGDSFVEYLEQGENTIGKLYESNYITQIIQSVLVKHKEDFEEENKDENLKNVLILDDLDRIDPEHIFRILNVFGAHFDTNIYKQKGLTNKFGFDVIILVCDINNIRKIFASRYGQDVDFSGYIDKFYTNSVYNFEIGLSLRNFLKNHFEKKDLYFLEKNYQFNFFLGDTNYHFFIELLILLYKYGNLSLRKIISLQNEITISDIFLFRNRSYSLEYEKGIIFLMLVIKVLGGNQNAFEAFDNLKTLDIDLKEIFKGFTGELFRIYTRDQHLFSGNDEITIKNGFKNHQNIQLICKGHSDIRNSYEVKYRSAGSETLYSIDFDNKDLYFLIQESLLFFKQIKFD